jgi:hypothetical protein
MRPTPPLLKSLQNLAIRLLGTTVHDYRSGQRLGKYLFLPWKGRIFVLSEGFPNDLPMVPEFMPRDRISYRVQVLAFYQHADPDFPRLIARQDRDGVAAEPE